VIIGIQQQQTEVGRIRLGVKTGAGRSRPTKLDRLRFTSPRRVLVDTIAHLYGGNVEAWQPPKGNSQWQVITSVTEVPVLIPPQDPADSQWYEMWSAGGCQRRCDGQTETISRQPCLCLAQGCAPEKRDCKMHTRIRVMLEDVPGLGCWRVDTGSYYAAVELPGVAALLATAQGAIPGKLVLDQRTVTRNVDGKPQTFNFAVPTLHVEEITPRQLMSGRVNELIAEKRAAAITGTGPAAIGSTVDYSSLVDAARSVDALRDLYKQAGNSGSLTPDLRGLLGAKAEELTRAEKAGEPDGAPLVDAEIVDGEAWLATQDPAGVA
jgi:hypothetical protein